MNEQCETCKSTILYNGLINDFKEMQAKIDSLDKEMNKLKTSIALSKQQADTILETLAKIENSIDKIADKLGSLEGKPGQRWEMIKATILTVGISATITVLITIIVTKLSK